MRNSPEHYTAVQAALTKHVLRYGLYLLANIKINPEGRDRLDQVRECTLDRKA